MGLRVIIILTFAVLSSAKTLTASPLALLDENRNLIPGQHREFAFSDTGEPKWLKSLLQKLTVQKQSRIWSINQHLLFHDRGRPTFLAVIWEISGSNPREEFRLYKILSRHKNRTAVRLVLRQSDMYNYDLIEPSGRNIDHINRPRLFYSFNSGGSRPNYGVIIHDLPLTTDHFVENPDYDRVSHYISTPKGWIFDSLLFDEPAKTYYMKTEGRDSFSCPACGQNAPGFDRYYEWSTPVYWQWQKDDYRPVCNKFTADYREKAAAINPFKDFVSNRTYEAQIALQANFERSLYLMQAHDSEAATARFNEDLQRLRELNNGSSEARQVVEGALPEMMYILEKAKDRQNDACPVR